MIKTGWGEAAARAAKEPLSPRVQIGNRGEDDETFPWLNVHRL